MLRSMNDGIQGTPWQGKMTVLTRVDRHFAILLYQNLATATTS